MSVENLSNEALKQLYKDTRKFKKSLALREFSGVYTPNEKIWKEKHQRFWRAWNELNNRYNAGLI